MALKQSRNRLGGTYIDLLMPVLSETAGRAYVLASGMYAYFISAESSGAAHGAGRRHPATIPAPAPWGQLSLVAGV